MVEVFCSGGDIHMELCLELWGDVWDTFNGNTQKERRVKAKNVNFGIPYGITAFGLAQQIKDTERQAQIMLDAWDLRFPVARQFLMRCRETVSAGFTMTTVFGRTKRPSVVTWDNINFLENEAANFPMQSIGSDITLMAAVRTGPQLRRMGVKIVNLVHDSIIMEVPDKVQHLQDEIIDMVKDAFAQVPIDYGLDQVPFTSDAAIGLRWGEVSEV